MRTLLPGKHACLALSTVAISLVAMPALANPISIQSTDISTRAAVSPIDDPFNWVWDIGVYNSISNDVTTSVSSSIDSTSTNADIDFQSSASNSVFNFGFTQTTQAGLNRITENRGFINFTATADSSYSIGGNFNWEGSFHQVRMNVGLLDITNPSNIVFFQDTWIHPRDYSGLSSLEVGTPITYGGYFGGHTQLGSITGDLVAGNQYAFAYQYKYESPGSCISYECIDEYVPETATTALGDLTLAITAKSVPEPAPTVLLLLGLLGLARARTIKGVRVI